MLDPSLFLEDLQREGVSFFAGVPDSLMKPLCGVLVDSLQPHQHLVTANEGTAVSVAAGHHLATNQVPLVYMQNSGQGNAVNPLISLADPIVYGIPMLLLIGWRGEPGVKDEPQHRKQGEVTTALFDAMDIPWEVLATERGDAQKQLHDLKVLALERHGPVAMVVKKGSFEDYKLKTASPASYPLSREEAAVAVAELLEESAAVVATTGKASRELYEYRVRKEEPLGKDFLTVGSMGHASQIALGIAISQPERPVCCLDGDGAALMHLGGMASIGASGLSNYRHVVINNGVHESVGGQPTTAGFGVDLCAVAKACGYGAAERVSSRDELKAAWERLMEVSGPTLLEIRVSVGSRANLGRPTTTPVENKDMFMRFLGNEAL